MNDYNVNRTLSPVQVLTVYADAGRNEFYLERREVAQVGGKSVLMAATPVTEDIMKEVARSYAKGQGAEMRHGAIIPAHLLYALNKPGQVVVLWCQPAMARTLNMATGLSKGKHMQVNVPATLYLVKDTGLYVYALMTDERPGVRTKLYNAPFGNVYDDGRVCLGSARLGTRSQTFEGEAERFERGFYMAEQTHASGNPGTKTPLGELWPKLAGKKTPFPSSRELMEHKTYKTLGDLLGKVAGIHL